MLGGMVSSRLPRVFCVNNDTTHSAVFEDIYAQRYER